MNSRSWMTRSSLAWVGGGTVPISSRKIVPLSATSNRPRRVATAPVKAPRTWPNSVDSSRSIGTEPVLTTTNGPSARGDRWWMARASSSLPVPDSPVSRMLERDGAARRTSSITRSIAGLRQIRLSRPARRCREGAVLGAQPALLEPLADREHDLLVLERLGDVVERALAASR